MLLLLLLLFLNALPAGEGTQGRDPSSDIFRTAMRAGEEGRRSHLPLLSSWEGGVKCQCHSSPSGRLIRRWPHVNTDGWWGCPELLLSVVCGGLSALR